MSGTPIKWRDVLKKKKKKKVRALTFGLNVQLKWGRIDQDRTIVSQM